MSLGIEQRIMFATILNLTILSIFIYVGINIFKTIVKRIRNEEKYEVLSEITKKNEEIIKNQIIQQHENRNQILILKKMINENDPNIDEYIDGFIDDLKEEKPLILNFPQGGLKGLFYYKVLQIGIKELNLCLDIEEKVENIIIDSKDTKDLSKIFGVFLDNAIENSSLSQEKIIGIECYLRDETLNFIIANSYEEYFELKSNFNSKEKKRGYGLELVEKIASKNSKILWKTEITNKYFTQYLIFKFDK